jgi:serine/threonine-protein kinase
MSPEQCSGIAPLTPASDVYSLGIILYEMLSGAVPFNADTPLALALKHVSEAPRSLHEIVPAIPEELERVAAHALKKDPRDRPVDANEFRRELLAIAERLGLEHAESTLTPTLEDLRHAGTESPSGRLVIDLATLRQVQAATSSDSLELPASVKAGDGAAAAKENRPLFSRLTVPLLNQAAGDVSPRARFAAAAMIMLLVFVMAVAVTSRWWNPTAAVADTQLANANTAGTASPTPTPSPSQSPAPVKKPERKKQEKPSKIKSLVNKVKGIFKR